MGASEQAREPVPRVGERASRTCPHSVRVSQIQNFSVSVAKFEAS